MPGLFLVTSDKKCFFILVYRNKMEKLIMDIEYMVCFIVTYPLPVLFILVSYVAVLCTFYKRKQNQDMTSSQIIDKADTELMKNCSNCDNTLYFNLFFVWLALYVEYFWCR